MRERVSHCIRPKRNPFFYYYFLGAGKKGEEDFRSIRLGLVVLNQALAAETHHTTYRLVPSLVFIAPSEEGNGERCQVGGKSAVLGAVPFSLLFFILDFPLRYEFSDMAKREGGGESLPHPIAQRRVCRIC